MDNPSPDICFSVIMPAFNVADIIHRAIQSLSVQSFPDWELIVCDDCSTDSTYSLLLSLSRENPRIRILQTSVNSGSAYLPRKMAAEAAHGRWIVELDADDSLSENYLQSAYSALKQSQADLLISRMEVVGGASAGRKLPADDVRTIPATGRELVRYTLNGWSIPLWIVCQRDLYLQTLASHHAKPLIFTDEEFSRRVLANASRAVFFSGIYYYHANPSSVTATISPARFSFLETNRDIFLWTRSEFGPQSEEYRKAARQLFDGICRAFILLRQVRDKHIHRICHRLIMEAWKDSSFHDARRLTPGLLKTISLAGPLMLKTAIYGRERKKR